MPLKKTHNYLLIYCLLGAMAFTYPIPTPTCTKWVLVHGCSLKVDGSTNINQFSCEIANYSNPDTIFVYKNTGKEQTPIALKGMLTLDVLHFNCHNPMMTNDLRKTLKSKEFGTFQIKFINLTKLPDFSAKQEPIKGLVEITLAGVTKQYDVAYVFSVDEAKTLLLIGTRTVTFSDFNLIPPRKLGGMIQAKDRLDVTFQLLMKAIN